MSSPASPSPHSAAPAGAFDRIVSLDVLRGVALLGILIMNIQAFAMPGAAYLNPLAYGDLTGLNRWTWILSHVFADQKFMSIFSMLFGAGVCLFATRAEAKTGSSALLHYRRTLWLLLFGLAHAHLLWAGDILVPYALCAVWVYPLRNLTATRLLVAGTLVMSVASVLFIATGLWIPFAPRGQLAGLQSDWAPEATKIQAEIEALTGSWIDQMAVRSADAVALETFVFVLLTLWRAGGMMLIGMAFFKCGVLTAAMSGAFYKRLLLWCGATGLMLIVTGVIENFRHDFSLEYSWFFGSQYNYWGSMLLSFAYVAAVMLVVQRGVLAPLQRRLAELGRTACSNYILQTVICTFIFYGHGLGLFGSVTRTQQGGIVLAVWLFQLWITPIWLTRFGFGPLEWAWRSLTYWRWQPLRRA